MKGTKRALAGLGMIGLGGLSIVGGAVTGMPVFLAALIAVVCIIIGLVILFSKKP